MNNVYAHLGNVLGVQNVVIERCDCNKGCHVTNAKNESFHCKWSFISKCHSQLQCDENGYLDFDKSKTLTHKEIHKLIMNRKDYQNWAKLRRKRYTQYYVYRGAEKRLFRTFLKAKNFLQSNRNNGWDTLTRSYFGATQSSFNNAYIKYTNDTWEYSGFNWNSINLK